MKRLKNTVTIKPGLEGHGRLEGHVSSNMVGNTQTDIDARVRGDTPENERDSIVQTPPRNENALTPMNNVHLGTNQKSAFTKLPNI